MTETNEIEHGEIIDGDLTELFKSNYTKFALSANARAIPDARDGCKPVHRRILLTAKTTAPSSRNTIKSARIVGTTLAEYHPHGDASVYDALCRMTQNFANNLVLIQGQGNFGAIDGSSASAQRYTEAKLHPLADAILMDGVNEGAVPLERNYDNSLDEPVLLPAKIPLLLLNGSPRGSIGVGFATCIPPHNAKELVNATKYVLQCLVDNSEPSIDKILSLIPGPDFPTGAIIGSPTAIKKAYISGNGILTMRSEAVIEEAKGRSGAKIIITSIPYGLFTEDLKVEIIEAAIGKKDPKTKQRKDPTVPEVKKAQDETTLDRVTKKTVVRLVIELKAGADPSVVLEKLMQNTNLMCTFAVNMVALNEHGQPIQLSVIDAITRWAEFRIECIRRQSSVELEKNQDRLHVISGLQQAIPQINEVIELIKSSNTEAEAILGLRELVPCTTKQAEAILSMQIRRLLGLRQEELQNESNSLMERNDYLIGLLIDRSAVTNKINEELDQIAIKLSRPRQTKIQDIGSGAIDTRLLVSSEECLVSITGRGYLKRMSASDFQTQLKGGIGKKGAKVKDNDILQSVISCHSHDRLFAVTDQGAVIRLEAHEIPTNGSGRHAANLGFNENEFVKNILPTIWPIPVESQAVFADLQGGVKRVMMSNLHSNMTKRLIFYKSDKIKDIVGGVSLSEENESDIFLASASGLGTRIKPSDIRLTQRNGSGVIGMVLKEDDYLVSIGKIDNDEQLILCCTSDGIGKRVASSEFPVQNRGGKGRILIKSKAGGVLVQALVVKESDTVLIATKLGQTVRIKVSEIRELGRVAMGSKLITLREGDEVISAAVLPKLEE
jgi:DNA gyrase subunit A